MKWWWCVIYSCSLNFFFIFHPFILCRHVKYTSFLLRTSNSSIWSFGGSNYSVQLCLCWFLLLVLGLLVCFFNCELNCLGALFLRVLYWKWALSRLTYSWFYKNLVPSSARREYKLGTTLNWWLDGFWPIRPKKVVLQTYVRSSLLYTIRGNPLRLLSTDLIQAVVLIVYGVGSVSYSSSHCLCSLQGFQNSCWKSLLTHFTSGGP